MFKEAFEEAEEREKVEFTDLLRFAKFDFHVTPGLGQCPQSCCSASSSRDTGKCSILTEIISGIVTYCCYGNVISGTALESFRSPLPQYLLSLGYTKCPESTPSTNRRTGLVSCCISPYCSDTDDPIQLADVLP